jgi:hypothetical protein
MRFFRRFGLEKLMDIAYITCISMPEAITFQVIARRHLRGEPDAPQWVGQPGDDDDIETGIQILHLMRNLKRGCDLSNQVFANGGGAIDTIKWLNEIESSLSKFFPKFIGFELWQEVKEMCIVARLQANSGNLRMQVNDRILWAYKVKRIATKEKHITEAEMLIFEARASEGFIEEVVDEMSSKLACAKSHMGI